MPSAYLTPSSPVIHFAGLSAVSAASDGRRPPNSRRGGCRLECLKGNQSWRFHPAAGCPDRAGHIFSRCNSPPNQPSRNSGRAGPSFLFSFLHPPVLLESKIWFYKTNKDVLEGEIDWRIYQNQATREVSEE